MTGLKLRGNSRERGDNVHCNNSTESHVDIQSLSHSIASPVDRPHLYRIRWGRGRCRDHRAHTGDKEKGTKASRSYSLMGPLSALHHKIVKSNYLSPTSVYP